MVSSPSPSPAHSSAEPVSSGLSASPLIIVSISPEDTQGEGLPHKDQVYTVIPTPDRRGNCCLRKGCPSDDDLEERTRQQGITPWTSQLRDEHKGSTIQNMPDSTLPEHGLHATTCYILWLQTGYRYNCSYSLRTVVLYCTDYINTIHKHTKQGC